MRSKRGNMRLLTTRLLRCKGIRSATNVCMVHSSACPLSSADLENSISALRQQLKASQTDAAEAQDKCSSLSQDIASVASKCANLASQLDEVSLQL